LASETPFLVTSDWINPYSKVACAPPGEQAIHPIYQEHLKFQELHLEVVKDILQGQNGYEYECERDVMAEETVEILLTGKERVYPSFLQHS